MNLDNLQKIAIITSCVVGIITVVKGVLGYSKNNIIKRTEFFYSLLNELFDILEKTHIRQLLDGELQNTNVEYYDKYKFLGFFEKIALMVNSGCVKKEIAYYMFGYYAIQCYRSDMFWEGLKRESYYWRLFNNYALEMQKLEKNNKGQYKMRL